MCSLGMQMPQLVVWSAWCIDLCLWYRIHIMLCFCVCRWNMYFSVTCDPVVRQHCLYDVYSVSGVAYKISILVWFSRTYRQISCLPFVHTLLKLHSCLSPCLCCTLCSWLCLWHCVQGVLVRTNTYTHHCVWCIDELVHTLGITCSMLQSLPQQWLAMTFAHCTDTHTTIHLRRKEYIASEVGWLGWQLVWLYMYCLDVIVHLACSVDD